MQIQIKEADIPQYDLAVIVEGECNHRGKIILSREDFGGLRYVNGELDWVEDYQTVLMCDKCRAYRFSEDEPWQGLSIMPMIHAYNFGKKAKEFEDVA